jgi:5-methylcytosine-specific restriction protein A
VSGSNAGGPYGGPWRRVRAFVLERDGYICQIRLPGCTTRASDADHIVPASLGGAWFDPSNLRAACKHCNVARRNGERAATPSRDW